jgi:Rieske Fe-S protein
VRDVPVGGGVLETVNNDVLVLLVAPSEGVIKAFDPTCPHAGATVGTPVNGVIACPAHGSQFAAATGALRRGPAPKGLTVVPVTIKGDSIVLT